MNYLIIKLGATGDVVRTTPLLHRLRGNITWVTASKNLPLLEGVRDNLRALGWERRHDAFDTHYDLAINLEDTLEVALFLKSARCRQTFGAYTDSDNNLRYTEDSARWFDLSLISRHGKEQADKLKFQNRRTYQEMIFEGLGFSFTGEKYILPEPIGTSLCGDVAIAADSGAVWPMKKWAYYAELKQELEAQGLKINILPERPSLREHLCDVRNHRCLVGGDSLPMHFALGMGIHCTTLFTCTSPWEIYDYGIQKKVISPLLENYFYQRGYDRQATMAIGVPEVKDAVLSQVVNADVAIDTPLRHSVIS